MKIEFKYTAYTDAGGKYMPDAERGGNEDNFFIADNLSISEDTNKPQDEIMQLGKLGMVMAVADGMGGMQAGEVASQIAVDTIKSAFTKSELKKTDISTTENRQKYLSQVIRLADHAIKAASRSNPSQEGMGSTIVIAWLVENLLTIGWCGDSRAYIYNDKHGLRLVTQDHSYVQELVNQGLLTYDQTFDHPQNNIVTRSLGDPTKEAKPDTKTIKVGKGDIIMLCSDGLSGVLRDRKTLDSKDTPYPEDNIESIIANNRYSLKACREALWAAAERNGWYDNVTVILCEITDGPVEVYSTTQERVMPISPFKRWRYIILGVVLILAVAITSFYAGRLSVGSHDAVIAPVDSIMKIDTVATPKEEVPSKTQAEINQDKTDKVRPTIQEQIKEQNQQKDTIESDESEDVLTPIKKDSTDVDKFELPHKKAPSPPIKDIRALPPTFNNTPVNINQDPE